MNSNELCFSTACDLAALIRRGEVSATEVMQAHIAQIERLNPKVNAVVTSRRGPRAATGPRR